MKVTYIHRLSLSINGPDQLELRLNCAAHRCPQQLHGMKVTYIHRLSPSINGPNHLELRPIAAARDESRPELQRRDPGRVRGETAILLLHLPLPLAGVSTGIRSGVSWLLTETCVTHDSPQNTKSCHSTISKSNVLQHTRYADSQSGDTIGI